MNVNLPHIKASGKLDRIRINADRWDMNMDYKYNAVGKYWYVLRASKFGRDGVKIYAKDYGKKAFVIRVSNPMLKKSA